MQYSVQYVNQPQQVSLLSGQPQTVLVQVPRQPSRIYRKYRSKKSVVLGGTQIATGILCVIFNIVGLFVVDHPAYLYGGHGIWCGAFFILTGSLGIAAGRMKSRCMIVAFMVLSIVSVCLALGVVLIASAMGLAFHASKCYIMYYDEYTYSSNYTCVGNAGGAVIVMEALLVILALQEGIAAICSSAICCAAVCCGTQPSQGQLMQINSPIVQCSQPGAQPQVACLSSQLQGAGYVQQPLLLQQAIPQQSFYPQQQQQPTQLLQAQGPQAAGVMTPPTYEHRQPPQQTKTSA